MKRDPVEFVREAEPGSVIALIGAPGTGKSRTAKAAAEAWPRRVVYEPHGERDRVEAARGKELFPWRGDLVRLPDLLRAPSVLDRDPLRLVIVPGTLDAERSGRGFAALCRLAWHTGEIAIVAEEAALYARHAVAEATLIATGGRHAGVRLVMVAQRWGRIPIDVRECVSHLVAYAGAGADLKELAAKCGAAFAQGVRALKRGDGPQTWRQGDAES